MQIQRSINDDYAATSDGQIVSMKYGKTMVLRQAECSGYGHRSVSLAIDGETKSHLVHRLVYSAFFGEIPFRMEVDHIDRNPANNRIDNLRLATRTENARNNSGHRGSVSRHVGVSFHVRINKWQASIRVNKRLMHLGYFVNESDAVAARTAAARDAFKQFSPQ